MVGIQCYPISLKLEGAETALREMRDRLGADAVLLCLNEVKCPEVFETPLPHLPGQIQFKPEGQYCFRPNPSCYEDGGLRPVTTTDPLLQGFDALDALVDASQRVGLKTYVWIQTFHLAPELNLRPEAAMVDFRGQRLENWACPSNSLAVNYNLNLIEDLLSRYPLTGIFIDRFRFPSPYDGIGPLLTCFCGHCREKAEELHIDYQLCREHVSQFFHWIDSLEPEGLELHALIGVGSGSMILERLLRMPGLFDWLRFRQHVITEYVTKVSGLVRSRFPDRELGLDIWTPAYAWMLGQDWLALEPLVDWMKPILYPMPFGPASLSAELLAIIEGFQDVNPRIAAAPFFSVLCRFFGFEIASTQPSFDQISSVGFPADIYASEMKRARSLVRKRKPLFAGCPIIDTGPDEVARRVKAVADTDADGIFLYCYDYASWENLDRFADIWGKRK